MKNLNENSKLFLMAGSGIVKIIRHDSVAGCTELCRNSGYRVLFVKELKKLRKFINKDNFNGSLELYRDLVKEVADAYENKNLDFLNKFELTHSIAVSELN